jgi:cytidylate kinase
MALTPRVDAMLGKQLARWEEAARATQHRPCVAIASLPGAGGEAVGRLVAERLGHGCFGREIVDAIADRRGIPHELMHGLDERVRSAVERYLAAGFQEHRFTESEYMKEIARFVTPIARRGGAVFVGRGAAFLLQHERALRVLVVAPFDSRVERWVKERGLPGPEATELLRLEDEKRLDFVRHHFQARLDDPRAYDLALNTASLGVEAAADDVVYAYRRRFGMR